MAGRPWKRWRCRTKLCVSHPKDKHHAIQFLNQNVGSYHAVCFIRSDGILDIFGEKFQAPSVTIYEYVIATINVKEQKLKLYLDKLQIDEIDYKIF